MKLLLKKFGIYFFPIIILVIALGLGASAGYVSVSGMAKTFPGAGLTMVILMALIESGKFIATTWLHKNSAKHSLKEPLKGFINKIRARSLNILITIMVVVVMFITSFGIYGFLSHGYMATANELEKSNREISLIDKKIEAKRESIASFEDAKETNTIRMTTLNDQRNKLETRLDSASAKGWWVTVNNTRKQIDESNAEIKKLTQSNWEADSTIQVVRDAITKLEVEKIEASNGAAVGEVGPLLYLSSVTGLPMDHIINYLILVIMFVFDPFAIVLLLAANRSFDKAKLKIKELEDKSEPQPTVEKDPISEPEGVSEELGEIFEPGEIIDVVDITTDPVIPEEKQEFTGEIEIDSDTVVYEGEGDSEDIKEKVTKFFEKKEEKKQEFIEKINELNGTGDEYDENEEVEEIIEEEVDNQEEVIEEEDNYDMKAAKKLLMQTLEDKRESIYLNFLEFVFDKGNLQVGDEMPSFQELKNKLKIANVTYTEKDLKDFLLICNLLKIVKADKSKRTVLKDYNVARVLVSNI